MVAFDPCNPCGTCIPSYFNRDAYEQAVLSALCAIFGAIETSTETLVEAGFADFSVSSITTGSTLLYDNLAHGPHVIRQYNFTNKLDVDVQISVDGGSTYPYYLLAGGGQLIVDLASDGLFKSEDIWGKAVGTNSSTGNFYGGIAFKMGS